MVHLESWSGCEQEEERGGRAGGGPAKCTRHSVRVVPWALGGPMRSGQNSRVQRVTSPKACCS